MQCPGRLNSEPVARRVEKAVALVAMSGAIAIAIGAALLAGEVAPIVRRRGER